MILGIDEVGRGPWAGPLVVGAVVLPELAEFEGLTDSKKLTAKKRLVLDVEIREKALGWGLGWVPAEEIDEIGLSAALRLATIRAVEAVKVPYHEIIIDGTINFLSDTSKGRYVKTMPKADLLVPAVSAASIIAKVARDTYMEEQNLIYPEYGFASHVGYGTAKHQQALNEHGITSLHRQSFAPIAKLLGERKKLSLQDDKAVTSTKSLGDDAESKVAAYLQSEKYVITVRNWRIKQCEIDIAAEKDGVRYFVEVKYRSSNNQGGGLAAITPKKLQQMQFAAELYNAKNQTSYDSQLVVASVDGVGNIELLNIE